MIATGAHLVRVALQRKRADEARRESERRLSTLMSNLPGIAYRCPNEPGRPMEFVSRGSLELTGYPDAALAGEGALPYDRLIHAEDREMVWREIQAALDEKQPFQLNYRILTASGEEKWVWEQGRGVYDDDGRLVALEGFISDITERVTARQMLEQRVTERTQELSTLLDVAHHVASTLALEPLLGVILDQLKEVVDYDGASVLVLDDETLRVMAYQGPIPQEEALQIQFALAHAGANRTVIEERRPIHIPDVRADTAQGHAFQETAGAQLDTTFDYVRSWLGVPLIVKGEVLGMLSLDHRQPGYYADQHSRLALAFAHQVGVMIENARLFAELERRTRIWTLYRADEELYRHLGLDHLLQALVRSPSICSTRTKARLWPGRASRTAGACSPRLPGRVAGQMLRSRRRDRRAGGAHRTGHCRRQRRPGRARSAPCGRSRRHRLLHPPAAEAQRRCLWRLQPQLLPVPQLWKKSAACLRRWPSGLPWQSKTPGSTSGPGRGGGRRTYPAGSRAARRGDADALLGQPHRRGAAAYLGERPRTGSRALEELRELARGALAEMRTLLLGCARLR